VACTRTWELPGLLVVGVDDDSMLRAGRRLVEVGGGWTVDDGDGITAEFAQEVLGVCTSLPVEEAIVREDAVVDALHDLGCDVEAPLLGLQTLTFPGVPSLKLSFSGYADIRKRDVVGLAAE
jgi:adenine deaminase